VCVLYSVVSGILSRGWSDRSRAHTKEDAHTLLKGERYLLSFGGTLQEVAELDIVFWIRRRSSK
jgi:hypothetical protein